MAIQEFLPYFIIGSTFISMAIISIVVYLLFPDEIYYWDKVYDKCSTTSAKHLYVIRFIFGKLKPSFKLATTTVTVEIKDQNKSLITLQIYPKQLSSYMANFPNPPLNTVRFLLYRKDPLLDICTVVVNHNGSGVINVTTIEIQDIKSKEANIAYIGVPIQCLNKGNAQIAQSYPSASKEQRPVEAEIKPNLTLRAIEFLAFLFIAFNIIFLMPVFVIPCPGEGLCKDYSEGLIASVYSGLTSGSSGALVFIILCCFYRYVIKSSITKGIKFCSHIRYGFLSLVIILGLVFGLIAGLMAAQNRRFPDRNDNQEFFHEVFWVFAVGIAFIVFFFFWLSLSSVIGRLIGFFSEPEEIKVEIKGDLIDKTVRTDSEEDDKSQDYYNNILKGTTKVKSISQYTGLQSKGPQKSSAQSSAQPSAQPSAQQSAQSGKQSSAKGVKRTASTESTGSGYYKQLMKSQGKVKSVSQYKGTKN